MIKEFLQSITSMRAFSIVFLLLMIVLFLAIIIYVITMKKKDIKKYSQLPLDNQEPPDTDRTEADHKEDKNGE
jgi:cbb3-type cytochrome oxidase subunit 3